VEIFKITENGISRKYYGIPVGEHFAVILYGKSWWIYVIHTGKRFVRIPFENPDAAVQFAQKLDCIFGEYMWIVRSPGWDNVFVPDLVQWTIPDGQRIAQVIKELQQTDKSLHNAPRL